MGKKTKRERELEKALRLLSARIIHPRLEPLDAELLNLIRKALAPKPSKAKPLSKELRAAYDKAHPRA